MKKFIYTSIVNIFFVSLIIIVAIVVTTISLTKKINDYDQQTQQNITATVEKNNIPILSLEKGVIETINVQEGEHVKKGELLVKITNPVVEQQVRVLDSYPDNVSASTEAALDNAELQYDNIYSPVDGIVGEVETSIDSPVDEYSQIMNIFQSDDTKLLAYLTVNQYLTALKMSKIPAFDERLNQNFFLSTDILKPDQDPTLNPSNQTQTQSQNQNPADENNIALYFKLANPNDANSLLNGETLELNLQSSQETDFKPIDYFVNFWNTLLK